MQTRAAALPLLKRHLQGLRIFLKVVIGDCQRNAALQLGKAQACTPSGGIFVTVGHRAPCRTWVCGEDRV